MSGSTLDPDNIPQRRRRHTAKGHDVASLGPSDSSDSGSDMKGPGLLDDDRLHLDRGTGEHLAAGKEPRVRPNQDRGCDRVVSAREAGLGKGLDEAEEARLGRTPKTPKR